MILMSFGVDLVGRGSQRRSFSARPMRKREGVEEVSRGTVGVARSFEWVRSRADREVLRKCFMS